MVIKAPRNKIGEPVTFIRRLGYALERGHDSGEISFARRVSGNAFPRFHIYYEERGDEILIKLHLDQKAPSYGGTSAHAGEYEGGVVETEGKRIENQLGG